MQYVFSSDKIIKWNWFVVVICHRYYKHEGIVKYMLSYDKKGLEVMVNNAANINLTKNHISLQITEHKRDYGIRRWKSRRCERLMGYESSIFHLLIIGSSSEI